MKVAIIGGFLGSGKTTAILNLGRQLSTNDQKVAIIVNEIGEIGIDGDTISSSGIRTSELTSGCICCSLRIDVENTLRALKEEFDPDIVLIEPTGIAFPAQIRDDLATIGIPGITFAPIICLVDGKRFSTEFKQIPKFIVTQIEEAEIIGINKIDIAPPERIPEVINRLREINEDAQIMQFSARISDERFQKLFSNIFRDSHTQKNASRLDSIEMSEISTYSAEFELLPEIDLDTARSVSEKLLLKLKEEVMNKSPLFIGHMKAIIDIPGNMVKTSLTSFEDLPASDIFEKSENNGAGLKLLTAVTGVEPDELTYTVERTVENVFESENIQLKKLDSICKTKDFISLSDLSAK
ncbi:cobalamin synthesis protein P47K [Methanosalsum zhilinae DSM 4017]|uniref:Cobalamin synthesis protein P47K n=1 Tax=Methanosalsum zhilinae (strain DSM 4017 / NBRC 107636 / OCM 62 / WeN5) TaxID=679901 RepID=F7XMG8_METZD|nr:GTP-binding protein [Methanosalsum zhilinae]AEH59891.1 cobalamin synthesis protein P47K [Methanosalsum zhilinae DSM 4017]